MSKKKLKNKAQNSDYKIEALEPRFMMDANVDLDGFENQIDNFSSVVENRVDTLNLNLSDFGLNSSYNAVSQLLGGVGNSVETALQTIYGNYRNSLSSQVSSVELNALIIGLAAGKDTLPAESLPLEIDEISFAKEGNDTLKVNLAYSRNVSVTELNLTNIGLNVENGFALNVSANISIALDFNQNNNNDWMENADDIGLTADVSEVNVVVPNMGVFATFMNLSVDEENDGVDDLSYIRSSDATSSELDLEFTIAAGANLPFSLPSDEYIEINKLLNENNIEVDFPSVTMDTGYSIGDLFDTNAPIDVTRLPFLNKFKISLNGIDYNLTQINNIARVFDEYWARTSLALNGIVDSNNSVMDFSKLAGFFNVLCQRNCLILIQFLKVLVLAMLLEKEFRL